MLNFKTFSTFVVAIVQIVQIFLIESSLQYSFYHASSTTSNNTGCVVSNYRTSEHWQLVYEDNFKENSSLDDWHVRHETTDCETFNGQYRSCNSRHNVRIIDGHLVVQANQTPHYSHQFSAAELIHKSLFEFGRYEIRMSHPVGAGLVSVLKVFSWLDNEHVDLSSTSQESVIRRGFQLRNGSYTQKNIYLTYSRNDGHTINTHNFNVYGLEWNSTVARLFMNELYSEPLEIGNIEYEMGTVHNLVMRILVAGQESQGKTQLLWTCPAMIFDYIRIFQRIYTPSPNSKCTFRPLTPDSVIDGICSQIMDSMDSTKSSKPILTTGQGILIIWLVILSCLNILGLALLFKLSSKVEGSNPNGSWMQWRWTNSRPDQLNDGFVRSTDNVS